MLFNSFVFLGVFLPLCLIAFAVTTRLRVAPVTVAVLLAASLIYYGYWDANYLWLIGGSILANYGLGRSIGRTRTAGRLGTVRLMMLAGIILNLAPLAYYKYAGFALDIAGILDNTSNLSALVLPLGISFFTFQQIAYLVDVSRGEQPEKSFLGYGLFVAFFPQLIAGPIVHYSEMLPQFKRLGRFGIRASDLSVGLTIFAIGLFKKTVVADGIATVSTPVFDAAAAGAAPDLLTAWSAALGYGFQLYFDFSAYSDMAIGVARMFGIRLPVNFHAPYRAVGIIDFWRRWHMTLSRFLRDFVYIPLGGNKHGAFGRYRNLMLTMLIGGLWHGAGWTFILWGGLHGAYLVIQHLWRTFVRVWPAGAVGRWSAQLLTFIVVMVAWVPFRADGLVPTVSIWRGMVGLNGVAVPESLTRFVDQDLLSSIGVVTAPVPLTDTALTWVALLGLCLWVWFLPTACMITRRYRPALLHDGGDARLATQPDTAIARRLSFRAGSRWAVLTGLTLAVSILAMSVGNSEFLYYRF